jgi:transposase-like protein
MSDIYHFAGISKQGYHQEVIREKLFQERLSILLIEVDILREAHPGCGIEKMYYTLLPSWLGRDRFVDHFLKLGYRVKPLRNYIRTTYPANFRFNNLIEGLLLWNKNQLWQSDITYFKVGVDYCYLVFIIDVYTKQIIGFQASNHMRAEANLLALKMAIKTSEHSIKGLIHHSDRGSQYGEKQYVKLLENNGAHISMGYVAQDNAYAERVNGTIKNEYLRYWDIKDLETLKKKLKSAVNHYNNNRIHRSLPKRSTPNGFEKNILTLHSQKRPTVTVYAEGKPKITEASSLQYLWPEKTLWFPVCPIGN